MSRLEDLLFQNEQNLKEFGKQIDVLKENKIQDIWKEDEYTKISLVKYAVYMDFRQDIAEMCEMNKSSFPQHFIQKCKERSGGCVSLNSLYVWVYIFSKLKYPYLVFESMLKNISFDVDYKKYLIENIFCLSLVNKNINILYNLEKNMMVNKFQMINKYKNYPLDFLTPDSPKQHYILINFLKKTNLIKNLDFIEKCELFPNILDMHINQYNRYTCYIIQENEFITLYSAICIYNIPYIRMWLKKYHTLLNDTNIEYIVLLFIQLCFVHDMMTTNMYMIPINHKYKLPHNSPIKYKIASLLIDYLEPLNLRLLLTYQENDPKYKINILEGLSVLFEGHKLFEKIRKKVPNSLFMKNFTIWNSDRSCMSNIIRWGTHKTFVYALNLCHSHRLLNSTEIQIILTNKLSFAMTNPDTKILNEIVSNPFIKKNINCWIQKNHYEETLEFLFKKHITAENAVNKIKILLGVCGEMKIKFISHIFNFVISNSSKIREFDSNKTKVDKLLHYLLVTNKNNHNQIMLSTNIFNTVPINGPYEEIIYKYIKILITSVEEYEWGSLYMAIYMFNPNKEILRFMENMPNFQTKINNVSDYIKSSYIWSIFKKQGDIELERRLIVATTKWKWSLINVFPNIISLATPTKKDFYLMIKYGIVPIYTYENNYAIISIVKNSKYKSYLLAYFCLRKYVQRFKLKQKSLIMTKHQKLMRELSYYTPNPKIKILSKGSLRYNEMIQTHLSLLKNNDDNTDFEEDECPIKQTTLSEIPLSTLQNDNTFYNNTHKIKNVTTNVWRNFNKKIEHDNYYITLKIDGEYKMCLLHTPDGDIQVSAEKISINNKIIYIIFDANLSGNHCERLRKLLKYHLYISNKHYINNLYVNEKCTKKMELMGLIHKNSCHLKKYLNLPSDHDNFQNFWIKPLYKISSDALTETINGHYSDSVLQTDGWILSNNRYTSIKIKQLSQLTIDLCYNVGDTHAYVEDKHGHKLKKIKIVSLTNIKNVEKCKVHRFIYNSNHLIYISPRPDKQYSNPLKIVEEYMYIQTNKITAKDIITNTTQTPF